MNSFKRDFDKEIASSRSNDFFLHFHAINDAFNGLSTKHSLFVKYKQRVSFFLQRIGLRKPVLVAANIANLQFTYDKLGDQVSKELLVKLMAYRQLGYSKVSLPLCNNEFTNGIKEIAKLADCDVFGDQWALLRKRRQAY